MDLTSAPDSPPAGSPTRRRPQPALWVFVGVVVLSVVGSLITADVLRSSGRAAGPADVVRSYLEALAAADATTALSYALAPPADQSLLTDAVLAESMRQAPMRDIQVSTVPGDTERVRVSYTLGAKDHDDTYTTTKVGTAYKLDHVTATVYLTSLVDKFPILVNGTPSTNENADVFPVTHAITTGLPNVDWGDDATFIGAVQGSSQVPGLQARITKAGQQAFVNGAKQRLGTCLKQHRLAPKNCPFGFTQPTSGPRVKESSVRWRVKGNPWPALADPEISSFTDGGAAKADTKMTFVVTCRFSDGQACRPQNDKEDVTFAGDLTTDPMKVVFTAF